jgi:2-succinyl-5-enolpyruvyl-6-hydroxy-3-cyclohexene-1-carboxylate synthase
LDRTNRNTALASAFIEELARSGVEHACVAPGSRSAPLALALWDEPGIRVWSHVDERCAGFFALGIAQATGQPAVVLTTSGTAGANVHPAVAEAGEARVPMIVLTADRPPELRGRGAGQTIDQLKLYGGSVRWFCELGVQEADDAGLLHFRSAAARAVAVALAPPPGPVHLNVPLREPLAPTPVDGDVRASEPLAIRGRDDGRPLTAVRRPEASPSPDLVRELARLVSEHSHGVILAGRQPDPGLAGPLAALARAAGYPVLAEPTSQVRSGSHDRNQVVASYDALLRRPPEELTPDLVLRFGDMVTSRATREWVAGNRAATQVVVDAAGAWNEPTATADLIVRASPGLLAGQLAEAVPKRTGNEWLERWTAASNAAGTEIDAFLSELGDELFEPAIHRRLGELLPAGSTVFVASSMPVRDLETFFPSVEQPLRFLANRGANGIDGLVSSALGAAVTGTGRTFALMGDLALYHDMNGLLATRRLGAEATIVVLNNGGGGIFDFLPIAERSEGYEEIFATPTGLDLGAVAALYGLPFTRLGSYEELASAIARPGLVEVPLDRKRNVELHRALFERVGEAVAGSARPMPR